MGSTGLIDMDLKVNTTKAKIRVLRTLSGYWKVKGRFIQNKMDPTYGPAHPEMYEDVAAYITEYTALPQRSKFWASLSHQHKMLFSRSLIFSDEVPTKFSVVGSERAATICIVLNGFATVQSSLNPNERVTYGQGECFGEFFHFDELTRFENAGRPGYDPVMMQRPDGIEEVLDVVVEKGALLHIDMESFKTNVWGHLPPEPLEIETDLRSDEEISGIAKELMTKADFEVVRVNRAAKKKLASVLYDFMNTADLLPKNAQMANSAGYLKLCEKGKSIFINNATTYIVIEGAMQLFIAKTGRKVKKATIGTANSEDLESCIKIKTNRLPLSILEVGTLLFLKDECFALGQQSALLPSGAMKPQFRAHLEAARETGVLPPTTTHILLQPRRDKKGRIINDGIQTDMLYQIKAEFDKTTVYLEIPEVKFRLAMDECPANLVESFEWQMKHSHDTIYSRIARLLPWIQGGHFGIEPESANDDKTASDDDCKDCVTDPLKTLPLDSHSDYRDGSLKGMMGTRHITMLHSFAATTTDEAADLGTTAFLTSSS